MTDGSSVQMYDAVSHTITNIQDDLGNNLATVEGVMNYPCLIAISNHEFVFTGGFQSGQSTNKVYIIDIDKRYEFFKLFSIVW